MKRALYLAIPSLLAITLIVGCSDSSKSGSMSKDDKGMMSKDDKGMMDGKGMMSKDDKGMMDGKKK